MNEVTLYGGAAGEKKPKRPLDVITVEQWIKIVNRLHKGISFELFALEMSQKDAVDNQDYKLNPDQVRHLVAVTRAVERVRIINSGVSAEAASRREKRALQDSDKSIEELEKKIDGFVEGRKP